MVRKQFLVAAACAAAVAFVIHLHSPRQSAPPPAAARVVSAPPPPVLRSARPRPLDKLVRPSSPYDDARSARYSALLSGADSDIVVVPCMGQVVSNVDRSERSLATAALNAALAARTPLVIAPTELVTRALGEWHQTLDDRAILALMKLTRAEHAVLCEQSWFMSLDPTSRTYVVHQNILIERYDLAPGQVDVLQALPAATHRYQAPQDERLVITDERPPHRGFLDVLPEALSALGFEPPTAAAQVSTQPATDAAASDALPADPAALLADIATDAQTQVHRLEFIAGLFPELPRDGRRRAATRLLRAAYALPPGNSRRAIALARGLQMLDQRPAALAALGQDDTPAARGLRAALNADLPAMEAAVTELPPGIDHLLAEFDLMDLRLRFHAVPAEEARVRAQALSDALPGWSVLLRRRLADDDPWTSMPAGALKRSIDDSFPLAGFALTDRLSGSMVLNDGGLDADALNFDVLRHIERMISKAPTTWCCALARDRVEPWDIVDLYESAALAELDKHVDRTCQNQGNCRRALELLDGFERSLRGHELLAFRRAQATYRLSERTSGEEAQEWARAAAQAARYAVQLADQPSWEAAQALQILTRIENVTDEEFPHVLSLDQQLPPSPYWRPFNVSPDDELRRDLQRMNFLTSYFQIAQSVIARSHFYTDDAGRQQLLATLDGRFVGNADKTLLEADAALTLGDESKAASLLEGALQRAMPQWPLYMKLGTLQLEQGHHAEALATYLRYPGFAADSGEADIAIDNAASEAGAKFFWRGLPTEARTVCARAAHAQSGSEGDLQCQIRTAILDGDFASAARGSIDRATHYRSVYAFRDYLSLLFAFGEPRDAWQGFAALAQRFDTQEVWAAADVGMRIEGRGEPEVRTWLRDDAQRLVSVKGVSFAAQFALRYYAVDRELPDDLVKFIAELQGPVATRVTRDGTRVVRSRPAPGQDYVIDEILGPSRYREHAGSLLDVEASLPLRVDPPAEVGEARGQVVSDLELFAAGYLALRRGEAAQAAQAFEEYARHYEPAVPRLAWVLPYLAAAIAPGDGREALRRYLDEYRAPNRRFDWHLAQAFVAVADNKLDAALEHLDRALDQRPHTEMRPIATQYQWAEACEWLWQRTRDARFKERLLTWAGQTSRSEPYVAWPHAVLAQYGTPGAARAAELGMALYLDPASTRLRDIPDAEKKRALTAFTHHNPFALANAAQKPRGT